MFYLLKRYRQYDPAAKSIWEIVLLYPGIKAIVIHRIAHWYYQMGWYFLARATSEIGRFLTGIDIHPGATIGHGVIIAHGMGVVIGETAIVGDDVILFQGVTLGGTELRRAKRHPTIESLVVVGAGAKVLGDITIGKGTRIGANSVVIESVEPYSTVVGIPARKIQRGISPGEELSHHKIKE